MRPLEQAEIPNSPDAVAMDFDQALAIVKGGLAQHAHSKSMPSHIHDTLVLANLLVKLVHRVAELERKLGEQT